MSRTALVLAASTLGALALGGCAVAESSGQLAPSGTNTVTSLDAAAVLSTARSNAESQSSVHLRGAGSCAQAGRFEADMALRSDGTGTGVVTTAAGTVSLVSTPSSVYVKGDPEFWATQTTAEKAAAAGTLWVRFAGSANPCFAALGSFSSVLANYLDIPGKPVKENSSSIHGVPAQLVSLPPDVGIWVSTTGPALPVYVSAPSAELTMSLSDWGSPVSVTVPSSAVEGTSILAG